MTLLRVHMHSVPFGIEYVETIIEKVTSAFTITYVVTNRPYGCVLDILRLGIRTRCHVRDRGTELYL